MSLMDRFFKLAAVEILCAHRSDLDFRWREYSEEDGWCIDFDVLVNQLFEHRNDPSQFNVQNYDWFQWMDHCIHFLIETPPTTVM